MCMNISMSDLYNFAYVIIDIAISAYLYICIDLYADV